MKAGKATVTPKTLRTLVAKLARTVQALAGNVAGQVDGRIYRATDQEERSNLVATLNGLAVICSEAVDVADALAARPSDETAEGERA